DEVLACSDRNGLTMTRRLAREDALFVGGSGGMAAWVALQVARRLSPDHLVVVLLPDTGERYLSKVHSDAWMRDNHLLDPSAIRVGDLVGNKVRALPTLLAVEVGQPLKRALALVEQHDITQVPVFKDREPVGTLYDSEILKTVIADPSAIERPVEQWMDEPLPVVRSDDSIERVTQLLVARNPAVLVRDNGSVVGILTRFDMLQFIAGNE
ncbi:MAG TPA: CBS domain-containing protein, partial [Candidatus Eisenbacteria bacterium]